MPRRFMRLAAATLTLIAILAAAGAPARAATGPELPAPTGALAVGTRLLYLDDTSRPDPWLAGKNHRELMVTAWYPAPPVPGSRAPYMSAQLSTAIVGSDVLSTVGTHAVLNAPPLPGRRPLVVLSAGFGITRVSLTALGEDLASRGYVVAAVDHTYEAAVEFPGGRLEPCLNCVGQGDANVVNSRVADLRFAIDQLTSPAAGLPVDANRIAVVGHAIGGAAAVDLLSADPRVDAAVNMDGTFFTAPPAQPVTRPVLLLGAQWPTAGGTPAANWLDRWSTFAGWRLWLSVPTAGHASFSDVHWLYSTFNLTQVIPPPAVPALVGTIAGERAIAITRAYVGAFLDRHLRGIPRPLLDRPSPDYPEVAFVCP